MKTEVKNIKDYLHLYLGCDYVTPNSQGNVNAFTIGEILKYGIDARGMQLILRPLSDMTEEEGIYCLNEVFMDHQCNYPKNDYMFDLVGEKNKNPRIRINNDWFDHTLIFGNNSGSIWGVDTQSQNVKIKAAVFQYLLSRGFDLFGLIDAGLAIDKTKLNSHGSKE